MLTSTYVLPEEQQRKLYSHKPRSVTTSVESLISKWGWKEESRNLYHNLTDLPFLKKIKNKKKKAAVITTLSSFRLTRRLRPSCWTCRGYLLSVFLQKPVNHQPFFHSWLQGWTPQSTEVLILLPSTLEEQPSWESSLVKPTPTGTSLQKFHFWI